MTKTKNLFRRGEMWWVRKTVPVDLTDLYTPSEEVRRSLKTRDKREAERRLPAALAQIEAEFQGKREKLKAAQREGEFIRSTAFSGAVERARDVASSIGVPSWDLPAPVQHPDGSIGFPQQWEPYPSNRGGALEEIETALDELEAEQAAATLAVGVDYDGEPRWAVPYWMVNELTDRMNEMFEAKRKTLEASRAQIEARTEEEAARVAAGGLAELLELWRLEKKPTKESSNEAGRAVRDFEAVCGPLSYKDVTPEHVLQFKRHLLENDTTAPATKKKKWSLLNALFNTAVNNRLLPVSPMAGITLPKPKMPSLPRDLFTQADLERLFAHVKADSEEWWAMRLGLYTGARLGELTQLRREDVVDLDGILHLKITGEDGKAVKNANSVRFVPLHRQLLTDGFAQWIEKKTGNLFSRPEPPMSKVVNRRIRSAGITEKGKVFHSFRHTFKSGCRSAGLDEDTHDRLTGHTSNHVGRKYGQHLALKEAIDKVRFGIETC